MSIFIIIYSNMDGKRARKNYILECRKYVFFEQLVADVLVFGNTSQD